MKDRETPLPLLRKWLRDYPDIYRQLDSCASVKTSGRLFWPDYCPLPINAAYTHLHHDRRNPGAARLAAELTACWAWRRSRILYDVDDDMARVLLKRADGMADSDIIPFGQLTRLPGHCVYVKVHHPDFSGLASTDGFFSWVDYDPNNGSTELRVQWLSANMEHTVPQLLRVGPNWTVKECVSETFGRLLCDPGLDPRFAPSMDTITHILLGTVQILLYIVSDGADIAPAPGRKHAGDIPADPNSVGNVNTVDLQYVGARVGAVIRGSRAGKGGGNALAWFQVPLPCVNNLLFSPGSDPLPGHFVVRALSVRYPRPYLWLLRAASARLASVTICSRARSAIRRSHSARTARYASHAAWHPCLRSVHPLQGPAGISHCLHQFADLFARPQPP